MIGASLTCYTCPTDVTVADPGREFAFNRSGPGIGSYAWRYRMQPTATGTLLTESFDASARSGPS